MLAYLPFLTILLVIAAIIQADAVMTVFYMIIGAFILGIWWTKTGIHHVRVARRYDDHAFHSQKIPVELQITNSSWLPIIWLELHESLPVQLSSGYKFDHVITLKPKERKIFSYQLDAYKRGSYALGPLLLRSGDVLGITKPSEVHAPADNLIIYPKIYPLQQLGLPSRSPFGTIKHHDPIFEDPSRMRGKRDYQKGDSIRRIDWKKSAATGKLLTKQFEASIDMEVVVVLDLHPDSYAMEKRFEATELAISTAASIAHWSTQQKQAVGLISNGTGMMSGESKVISFQPEKGSAYLMSILEALANVTFASSVALADLLYLAQTHLKWGTTLVIISGAYPEHLLDQIMQMLKSGLNIVLILVGFVPNHEEAEAQARQFGFKLFYIRHALEISAMEERA